MSGRKRIVIGALDGHAAGWRLLSRRLRDAGFDVIALGNGCAIEDFVRHASDADALLVSSHDLCSLSEVSRVAAAAARVPRVPWYFRGELTPEASSRLTTCFRRVFVRTVSAGSVIAMLRRDLSDQDHRGPGTLVESAGWKSRSDARDRTLTTEELRAAFPACGRLGASLPRLAVRPAGSMLLQSSHPDAQGDFDVTTADGARQGRHPFQLRRLGPTRDAVARACGEGAMSIEGGAISHALANPSQDLSDAISSWQEVDRLVGYLAANAGADIDREVCGVIGAPVPPSLSIAIALLEMLLAARQGVKRVSLSYGEQGNREQDVAALRALRSIATSELARHGFDGVEVGIVFHQYPGAFPLSRRAAGQLVAESAATGALGGADRCIVRTDEDGVALPSAASMRRSATQARAGIRKAERMRIPAVGVEERRIIREVKEILAGVEARDPDLASAIVMSFNDGTLDVPSSPSRYCRTEVVALRDEQGAVRYAETGNLPLSKRSVADNRAALASRMRRGTPDRLVEEDVDAVKRLSGNWPLGSPRLLGATA